MLVTLPCALLLLQIQHGTIVQKRWMFMAWHIQHEDLHQKKTSKFWWPAKYLPVNKEKPSVSGAILMAPSDVQLLPPPHCGFRLKLEWSHKYISSQVHILSCLSRNNQRISCLANMYPSYPSPQALICRRLTMPRRAVYSGRGSLGRLDPGTLPETRT